MEILTKPSTLLIELKSIEVLQGIEDSALEWLINRSELRYYPIGTHLFEPEQAVDHMQIILEGSYVVNRLRGKELQEIGVWEAGHISGVLPFSRMKEAKAFGKALEDCRILELHRQHFIEMVNVSYELTQALVGVMTDRVRDYTQMHVQNEKLMALGKLSAGLAHELNNPASAIVRSSEELYKKVHSTPEKFKSIMSMSVTPDQTDCINTILFAKIEKAKTLELSLMEREEKLDDLVDWLEDHDIKNGEDIAETFVDFGMEVEDLDEIYEIIEEKDVGAILWWLESTMSLEKLVEEIREGSDRIAELVKSVKSYTHMDRAKSREPVDIHEGIKNTIIMLKHKFKHKNISIEKDVDWNLPKVVAFAGELNQVWTNIIVNAIDAMDQNGRLQIRTYQDRHYVCVDITDNGKGISEENITRIFDPFFTTKGIGEGTGMGLDIVKRIIDRSKGAIEVTSKPGKTTFSLCFPAAE